MFWGGTPIVSLDKIYINDNKKFIFIDCTRLDGSKELVSRVNPNDVGSVFRQVKDIAEYLKCLGINKIILADDVVFTGSVINSLIQEFRANEIFVVGVRSAIATVQGLKNFSVLPEGLKCGYVLGEDVIDQICERDFYFGVVQSGISIKDEMGAVLKAPYFVPFGDPVTRASIPKKYEQYFSDSCLDRSIYLWQEIEILSDRKILIRDLPEKINKTKNEEEVIRTLKRRDEK